MPNTPLPLTIFSWEQYSCWDLMRTEYRSGDILFGSSNSSPLDSAKIYSPLFFPRSTTLLYGDEMCLNFLLRITASAMTACTLMKNWTVQTSSPIPVVIIVPATDIPRIYHEIERTPCLSQKIIINKISQIYQDTSLLNCFAKLGIVFIDSSCIPDYLDFYEIRKKMGIYNAVVIFHRYKHPSDYLLQHIDSSIRLKRIGFGNERDFMEAQIISNHCKNKKFYFSMNYSSQASWLCRYDDRPATMQRTMRISPQVQQEIIRARCNRQNMVPIRMLAERFELSVATVNRFLKQHGLAKQASPDGKKRGRKHTLRPDEYVNFSNYMAEASLSSLQLQVQPQPNFLTEIQKVHRNRFTMLGQEDLKIQDIAEIINNSQLSSNQKLECIKKLL